MPSGGLHALARNVTDKIHVIVLAHDRSTGGDWTTSRMQHH